MINKDNILDYLSFLYKNKYGKDIPIDILESWKELNEKDISSNLKTMYKQWNIDNGTINLLEKNYTEQEKLKKTSKQKTILKWIGLLSLLLIIFMFFLLSLKKEHKNTAQSNNELTEENPTTPNTLLTQKDTIEEKQISMDLINTWFQTIFNAKLNISQKELNILSIDLSNYKNPPNSKLQQQLNELKRYLNLKPKVKVFSNSIHINYSSEYESLSLFFLEDKFIYTLFGGGSNGISYEYNLKTKKYQQMDFVLLDLENRIGIIERNYFDPRGPEDPNYQGHVYENGTIDFYTGKINWD